MSLTTDLARFAAYYVVGYGTEIQNNSPYKIARADSASSGFSLGVTQSDLHSSGTAKATQLLAAYNAWRTDSGLSSNALPSISLEALRSTNPLEPKIPPPLQHTPRSNLGT